MNDVDSTTKAALVERIKAHSQPLTPIATGHPTGGALQSPVRAVLLDVYGTMLLSGCGEIGAAVATDNAQACLEALGELSMTATNADNPGKIVDALTRAIKGDHQRACQAGIDHPEVDIRAIWRSVLLEARARKWVRGSAIEADAEIARFAIEYECRVNPTWPMPDLVETLTQLRSRGIVLGIVSNAQFFTPLLFDALLGQSVNELGFDPALCVWSFAHKRAKPSPLLFQPALKLLQDRFQISPEQVVYVGNDMRNDIAPPLSLGCQAALFAGDQRSLRLRTDDPSLAKVTPTATIDQLSQLLDLI